MQGIGLRSAGLSLFVLAAVSLTFAEGHPSKATRAAMPLPTDWSHRHLIFSHPRTPDQAARLQGNARYLQQQARHNERPHAALKVDDLNPSSRYWRHHRHPRRGRRMHRDWSTSLGVGASVGAARFPAKYSFSTSVATCGHFLPVPDYVVFPTGAGIPLDQASITAFTNLYQGCGDTGNPVPGSFWAYDTGGLVNTSPVISLDGTQVAFTQFSGGTSSLVLLKWAPFNGSVQAPIALTSVAPDIYAACAELPCMTTFDLGSNDTNSSVFYDYGTDTAWVGDDAGKLHQFSGIFLGVPAEVVNDGWPAAVGGVLTSAVHDGGSGNTFVGDDLGFLYRVDIGGGVIASAQLDFGTGLTEGPVVDVSAGSLYVFSSNDGVGTGSAAVFQLSTLFEGGDPGTKATVGTGTTLGTPLYDGAFDHNYIFSATTPGNLYVCGNPGGQATLYQIPISGNVMGTPKAGPIVSTTTETPCSPVTDVYNAVFTGAGLPQEWVFMSTEAAGVPAACTGFSCIMSFKVTQWQPGFNYGHGQEVLDGNFNIEVVDNIGGFSGGTTPGWGLTPFSPTVDGAVNWRNQGAVSSFPPAAPWAINTDYSGASEVIDANNNIEIAEPIGGTSGGSQPDWGLPEGSEVNDNGITWYNLGLNPTAALPVAGGTSGIIIDNLIDNPGGSQVYFSTLGGGCDPGGTGGCAVQASQDGLN